MTTTSSEYDDTSFVNYDEEVLLANQPIYEYELDNSVKYFQADTSYIRLQ